MHNYLYVTHKNSFRKRIKYAFFSSFLASQLSFRNKDILIRCILMKVIGILESLKLSWLFWFYLCWTYFLYLMDQFLSVSMKIHFQSHLLFQWLTNFLKILNIHIRYSNSLYWLTLNLIVNIALYLRKIINTTKNKLLS